MCKLVCLSVQGSIWKPLVWRRGHIVLVYSVALLFMVVIIEFSYSSTYGNNQYVFLVVAKLLSIVLNLVMNEVRGDPNV